MAQKQWVLRVYHSISTEFIRTKHGVNQQSIRSRHLEPEKSMYMAKVYGPIPLIGRYDDLNFYMLDGENIARKMPGPDRQRVLKDKVYKRFRKIAARNGLHSTERMKLQFLIKIHLGLFTDDMTHGRFNGVLWRSASRDRQEVAIEKKWYRRALGDPAVQQDWLDLVYRRQTPLSQYLPHWPVVVGQRKLRLQFAPLRRQPFIRLPEYADGVIIDLLRIDLPDGEDPRFGGLASSDILRVVDLRRRYHLPIPRSVPDGPSLLMIGLTFLSPEDEPDRLNYCHVRPGGFVGFLPRSLGGN